MPAKGKWFNFGLTNMQAAIIQTLAIANCIRIWRFCLKLFGESNDYSAKGCEISIGRFKAIPILEGESIGKGP
jgi:hypothetical protein